MLLIGLNGDLEPLFYNTDKKEAQNADVVLLCAGEQSYAEWNGDTADLELCGALGLPDNKKAIEEAKTLGKPTIACIIAGRNVIINPEGLDDWDSVVMCYLPGTVPVVAAVTLILFCKIFLRRIKPSISS